MADEAVVVGQPKQNHWLAGCARCGWSYSAINRETDMAARAHVLGCGGDVTVRAYTGTGSMVTVLELERDVRGRVVNAPEEPPRSFADQTLHDDSLAEFRRRDYYR